MKFGNYLSESFARADLKNIKKKVEKHLPKEDLKMSTTFSKMAAKKYYFVEIAKNKTFPKGFALNVTTDSATDAKAAAFQAIMSVIDKGEDVSKKNWKSQL